MLVLDIKSILLYTIPMENEKILPEDLRGVHIHFVGIKGTGMAALVEILVSRGAVITGSDVSERFYTDEILEALHLRAVPFSRENITDEIQYVVYSSAYNVLENPDLIAASERHIPCLLYTEALGSYSALAYSCGICGVHGKTSTAGIAGTVLAQLPLPSQVLAGSVIHSFGERCTFTSPDCLSAARHYFVAETCEYQRHFMSFCPQKIVLTSVESDHQDYYPTFADIQNAFVDYICRLPEGGALIFCADDSGAFETAQIAKKRRPDITMIPYGERAAGEYHLEFTGVVDEKNTFSLQSLGDLAISVPGKHEVRDAAAALALVSEILKTDGKNPLDYKEEIRNGLKNFSGGKRRSEVVGEFKTHSGVSVVVLDDYGHHPTAIKTTLKGYREFYKGRKIIVDFMSHTYSRTESLLSEFAASFSDADVVVLHKIYASARERPADFTITGKTLFEETKKHHKNVHYFEEILDAQDFVLKELEGVSSFEYPKGCLLVTMGAGDNWRLGNAILGAMTNE